MQAQRNIPKPNLDPLKHLKKGMFKKKDSAALKKMNAHLEKLRPWIDEEATPEEREIVKRALEDAMERFEKTLGRDSLSA